VCHCCAIGEVMFSSQRLRRRQQGCLERELTHSSQAHRLLQEYVTRMRQIIGRRIVVLGMLTICFE